MIPPATTVHHAEGQTDEDRLCQKVVQELLRRQSVSDLAVSLGVGPTPDRCHSPPSRRVPIVGRNGQDSTTSSLDANTISSLIQQLQAEEARLRGNQISPEESSHNKLSRSVSLPVSAALPEDQNMMGLKTMNMDRYKTELCRQFQETGFCKYGAKCQFAHGVHEIRNTSRHPKYKTDLCRTYHTSGICPYGTRCHFIHDEDDLKLSAISHQKQQQVLLQIRQYRAMNRARSPLSPTNSVSSSMGSIGSRRYSNTLGYQDVAMSLSSSTDTTPSSLSSSPAPSPTPFMFEERYHSAPTPPTMFTVPPPPGFSAPPRTAPAAVADVFTYPDLPVSYVPEPARTFRVPSPININIPCDPMASLAAGLQAAVPKGEDLVKDCMSDFLMFPSSSPTTYVDTPDSDGEVCTPMDVSRNLRLPIFSQLSRS